MPINSVHVTVLNVGQKLLEAKGNVPNWCLQLWRES